MRPSVRGARGARLTTFFLSVLMMALTSAVAPAATASIGCGRAASRELRVYLINEAGAAPRTLDAAKAEAGAIWANAGLRLTWTSPPTPLDFDDGRTVVVMVRRALLRPPLDAADVHCPARASLGWLVFGEDGRPGNLIEVSFQALTSLVMRGSQLDRPIHTLPSLFQWSVLGRGLGRVVAHEIGHWLMGRGHTEEGLMKPAFETRDLVGSYVPRVPRAWTTAGAELRAARSARCEADALRPLTRE